MGVDVVALLQILHDLLEHRVLALGDKFVEAALRAHFRPGRHEDFDLRVREDGGADVTAVHDHAARLGEGVQARIHPVAHVRDGGDRTHLRGDFHGADQFLDVAFAHVERGTRLEVQVQALQGLFQRGVDGVVRGDEPLLLRKEGDAAVQGAGVQVQEVEVGGDQLGKRALAGGGIAVDGYGDVRDTHGVIRF